MLPKDKGTGAFPSIWQEKERGQEEEGEGEGRWGEGGRRGRGSCAPHRRQRFPAGASLPTTRETRSRDPHAVNRSSSVEGQLSRFRKGSTLPGESTGQALVLQATAASEQPTEAAGSRTREPRTAPSRASRDECFDRDDTTCPVCKIELTSHPPAMGTARTAPCRNIYGTRRGHHTR